jgi:hypothetical protein
MMTSPGLDADRGDPDQIRVGSLVLEVGQSCLRRLNWEVSYERPAALALLLERPPRGFSRERRSFGLCELGDAFGHTILIVERSLRTQIRVHYLTPPEERGVVATEIAERILERIQGSGVSPQYGGGP